MTERTLLRLAPLLPGVIAMASWCLASLLGYPEPLATCTAWVTAPLLLIRWPYAVLLLGWAWWTRRATSADLRQGLRWLPVVQTAILMFAMALWYAFLIWVRHDPIVFDDGTVLQWIAIALTCVAGGYLYVGPAFVLVLLMSHMRVRPPSPTPRP